MLCVAMVLLITQEFMNSWKQVREFMREKHKRISSLKYLFVVS